MHSNTVSFSIKSILCENSNILSSKNYWKLGKRILDSERTFKTKGRLCWTKGYVKRNFAYVSNYLHLKSFERKRYCPTSLNYKRHEFDQGHSRKLLQSSTNYIQIGNTKTTRPLFKGSWVLLYFWHSNWHYFGYISGKVAKPDFLENPQNYLKTRQYSYE